MHPLPLADLDHARLQVEVRDPHPKQFAPPGAGVGGGRHQGMDPRVAGDGLDMIEQPADLVEGQVENLP